MSVRAVTGARRPGAVFRRPDPGETLAESHLFFADLPEHLPQSAHGAPTLRVSRGLARVLNGRHRDHLAVVLSCQPPASGDVFLLARR